MKKNVLFFILIVISLISCGEEELILESPSDSDSEIVAEGNNDDGNSNTICDDTDSNETTITNEILALVNQHRESIGKSVLELNCIATNLSITHTEYMIGQNEISHDGFQERFQDLKVSVDAKSAGENVASGYSSAKNVMNAWLNSEGHKQNIEGNFTHVGLAAIKNAQGKLFYTQLFFR